MGNNNSVKRIAAALGEICSFWEEGVPVQVSQSKFVGLAWPLALNISFRLGTLRLSIKNLPA